jgi:hypothetical protein
MKSTPSVPLRSDQSVPSASAVEDDSQTASAFWNLSFAFALASISIFHRRFFDVLAKGWKIAGLGAGPCGLTGLGKRQMRLATHVTR